MGHDPNKWPLFFIQKYPDNLPLEGHEFPYPPMTQDMDHEIEVVFALRSGGNPISVEQAMGCVFGYLSFRNTERLAEAGEEP